MTDGRNAIPRLVREWWPVAVLSAAPLAALIEVAIRG